LGMAYQLKLRLDGQESPAGRRVSAGAWLAFIRATRPADVRLSAS
jgi:hypothetical protein